MPAAQSSYAELAELLENLPVVVKEARRARRLSLRAAAKQIGVSFSTVQRLESRKTRDLGVQLDPVLRVLRWLDDTPALADQKTAEQAWIDGAWL